MSGKGEVIIYGRGVVGANLKTAVHSTIVDNQSGTGNNAPPPGRTDHPLPLIMTAAFGSEMQE